MTDVAPVDDWAGDYDILDPGYVRNPYGVWDELRGSCPVAHTDRHGGSWMPTSYADVDAIAHDTERFSSRNVGVIPPVAQPVPVPPIDADPPDHHWSRRLILPAFAPKVTLQRDEPYVRDLAKSLIAGFVDAGRCDAAADYAQQIPPRAIAHIMGIDEERCDEFVEWVRGVLELGALDPELRVASRDKLLAFFTEQVRERLVTPRDDLISELLAAEVDGQRVTPEHVIGTCNLLLIAGIDTTWSSIGSALWHLAEHPDDRRRLVEDPSLIPVAVEELLRAYSPVTMARIVAEDTEFNGCPMRQGDRIILNFPAANRDPEMFDRPDEVVIDRAENRHIAFGAGIHRCAGSNLARLEMRVALEEWLAAIPDYELEDPAAVTWAGGQVRGPRSLPVVFS